MGGKGELINLIVGSFYPNQASLEKNGVLTHVRKQLILALCAVVTATLAMVLRPARPHAVATAACLEGHPRLRFHAL